MNQGRIVEYIDQETIVCTFCLQDKVGRLHLVTATNRDVTMSAKRALLISSSLGDASRPREQILAQIARTEETREGLKAQVNVRELWELVKDEPGVLSQKDLAALVFGEPVSDDHLSALYRALFADRLYFKLREGGFVHNSEEKVETLLRQKAEEAHREALLGQGAEWLREALRGRILEGPATREEILDLLKELALHGQEAPRLKLAKELLTRAGISDIRHSRRLLVSLGVWDEDENLDLLRLGIETSFPEAVREECRRMQGVSPSKDHREDLTDLTLFTIDGESTKDFDDALSVEVHGDQMRLGIHIADVASLLPADSPVYREAASRAASHYLPKGNIPMLPEELSQDTLSLRKGCDRLALSLFVDIDREGRTKDWRFVPSLVRIRHRLTYGQVSSMLSGEEDPSRDENGRGEVLEALRTLAAFSQRFGAWRIEQGALPLLIPEVQVMVREDGRVELELLKQDEPSRLLVSECMILYNWMAARFCRDHGIPTLYRTQGSPSELLQPDPLRPLYYVLQQRRRLSPVFVDTAPGAHYGLGIDVYTQASSPIRRYLDLVVQRQILGVLMGRGAPLDREGLEALRVEVSPSLKSLTLIKRKQTRYWTLKYLLQNRETPLRALVLDEMRQRYRILLVEVMLTTEIHRKTALPVGPGESFLAALQAVDPWEDVLDLECRGPVEGRASQGPLA